MSGFGLLQPHSLLFPFGFQRRDPLFSLVLPSLVLDLQIVKLCLQLAVLLVESLFGSAVVPLPFLSLDLMAGILISERFGLPQKCQGLLAFRFERRHQNRDLARGFLQSFCMSGFGLLQPHSLLFLFGLQRRDLLFSLVLPSLLLDLQIVKLCLHCCDL